MNKRKKRKKYKQSYKAKPEVTEIEVQKKNYLPTLFIICCIALGIVFLNTKDGNTANAVTKDTIKESTESIKDTENIVKTTIVEETVPETTTGVPETTTETTTETTVANTTGALETKVSQVYNFMVYASGTGNTGKEETITTNIAVNGSVMGNNIAFNNVMTTSTIKDGFIAYKIVTNNDSVQSTDIETFNGTFAIADKTYNANIRVVHEVGSVTYLIQESEQIAKETIPETKKSLVSKYKDTIKIGD